MSAIIPTLSVCSGKDCMIKGLVNGVPANILVDTGAATTALSKCTWDNAREQGVQLQSAGEWKLVGVQGIPLHLHESTQVWLELPPEKFRINVIVADTPAADVILGRDFLRSQKCTIEMGSTSDMLHIKIQGQRVAITQDLPDTVNPGTASHNVVLQELLTIPPHSEVKVICTQ